MKTTLNRGATPTGGLEWDLLHDIQIQIDSARHLVNAAFMAASDLEEDDDRNSMHAVLLPALDKLKAASVALSADRKDG